MGNCCGGYPEDKDDIPNQNNAGPTLAFNNDPVQYKTASRDEVAAAAERRLADQRAKNEIKTLRHTSAELPDVPNTGKGGLKWQVG